MAFGSARSSCCDCCMPAICKWYAQLNSRGSTAFILVNTRFPWAVFIIWPEEPQCLDEQEQQRVAAWPGNAHCMSVHQVSSIAAWPPPLLHPLLQQQQCYKAIYLLTSCGAKAQQTPPQCCASRHRAISPTWPKNWITSSRGHSTPSLKILCKSIQPFCRNLANKETKKVRYKQRNKEIDRKQYPVTDVSGAG